MKIIKSIKALEEQQKRQLNQENEIMGKALLQITLKHHNFTHPQEYKTDEEIRELLDQPDWKEKNKFWTTWIEGDKDHYISYKTVNRRLIKPRNIIVDYEKKIGEQVKEIEGLKEELKEERFINANLKAEMKIIEEGSLCHFEAIKACEDWYVKHPGCLKEQLNEKAELLGKTDNNLKIQEAENRELKKLLEQSEREKIEILRKHDDNLKKHEIQKRELQRQLDLANESLSKKSSKLKLGKKIKIKSRHLIERIKHKSQELIAKIEIRTR